jgi:hypothetical protein
MVVIRCASIDDAGICSAFSVVSTVENINHLVTGEMITLSE